MPLKNPLFSTLLKEEVDLSEVIKTEGKEVVLRSKDGKKVLGRFPFGEGAKYENEGTAKTAAGKREKEVSAIKHAKEEDSAFVEQLSKDQEIELVSAAFRKQFRPSDVSEFTPFNERPFVREVFDDFVLVKLDAELFRVNYTMDAQHIVTFDPRETWKKAEMEVRTIESGLVPVAGEYLLEEGDESIRTVFGEHLPVVADLHEDMEADIVVIEPGFGNPKDNHFYPRELIKKSAPLFEGAKMFVSHSVKGRDVSKWVATIKESGKRFSPTGAAIAKIAVHSKEFWESLQNLDKHGLLHTMHNSILAVGKARKGKVNGKQTNIVEDIVKVKSVDFVPQAGAGGHVMALAEEMKANDIDAITCEAFVEQRPDIVIRIQEQYTNLQEVQVAEELKELKEQLQAAEAEKGKLSEKNTALLKEKGEQDQQLMRQEAVEHLREKSVDEKGRPMLPEPSVLRIKGIIEEGVFAEDADVKKEVETLIEQEIKYLKSVTKSSNGKIVGMGEAFKEDSEGAGEKDTRTPEEVLKEEDAVLVRYGVIEEQEAK